MASMNYCLFENTKIDLQASINKMAEANIDDWGEYERIAVKGLFFLCHEALGHEESVLSALEEAENDTD